MRRRDTWGDNNILIGAALLFGVRIHVVSDICEAGVTWVQVPATFGSQYAPTADICLALSVPVLCDAAANA